MDLFRAGQRAPRKGPPAWFTGDVTLEPIVEAPAPATVSANSVTFAAGARTAWHTHPLGQTLVVTAGLGLCQSDGGPIRTIRPGDVVTFAPGERHWHGAAPDRGMSHIAIHEVQDGRSTDWLEPVSDADYGAEPQA